MFSSVRKTPLVVVSGFDRPAVMRAATALARPGTVVVHHDLSLVAEGIVTRTVTRAGMDGADSRTTQNMLDHGCLSCAMSAEILPLLRHLHRWDDVDRIVLALDPALEPEPVCFAITHSVIAGVPGQVDGPAAVDVEIEAVVGCLDEGTWLDDVLGDVSLGEDGRGDADDERTVAQLAVGHAEFADALIVGGQAVNGWAGAQMFAVLKRLNPRAPIIMELPQRPLTSSLMSGLLAQIGSGARRGRITGAHDPLLRGQPPLESDCGVCVLEFEADRPFHPERLHDAIDALLDGVVAARGRLWLATQPDEALWLESAGGGLRVATGGAWLAAMSDAEVAAVDPERRAMASLRWHPLYGDRGSSIVAVTVRADPAHIRRELTRALLTDGELAAGQAVWDGFDDPFGHAHIDPCDDVADTSALLETLGMRPDGEDSR